MIWKLSITKHFNPFGCKIEYVLDTTVHKHCINKTCNNNYILFVCIYRIISFFCKLHSNSQFIVIYFSFFFFVKLVMQMIKRFRKECIESRDMSVKDMHRTFGYVTIAYLCLFLFLWSMACIFLLTIIGKSSK